jgi:hypothetical protein
VFHTIDPVIAVAKSVSHSANIRPWLVGHHNCGGARQPKGCFADPFQAPLNRIARALVSRESSLSMSAT